MMSDPVRADAYSRAIAAVVRPGDVVLDIGAGAGVFSLLALGAGAARVYAIERSEIIDVGRQLARASDATGRIEFIQGDSTRIDLPEPADVLVSDLHGSLPLLGNSLHAITDARRRLLRTDARLIPRRETVFVAPVDCCEGFSHVEGWRAPKSGLDYSFLAELAANEWFGQSVGEHQLLAPGAPVATIDYAQIETYDLEMRATYSVSRPGAFGGLGAWFVSDLAPGVELSTAPDRAPTVFSQAFFPLFRARAVAPGDTIAVEMEARFIDRVHYFGWTVRIERRGAEPETERHSELEGVLFSPERILKSAEFFTPSRNADGEIERAILEMMDGRDSLRAIAERLAERFPTRFSDWRDAMPRVREVSYRFSS
jgi:SAM-dependent methyltransferase